jgi:hypothetical protein
MSRAQLKEEQSRLQKTKVDLEKRLHYIYEKLNNFQEEEDLKIIQDWIGSDEDWKWLLSYATGSTNETQLKYEFVQKKAQELGISIEGYWNITKQRYLKISQYYNNFEGYKKLLPYIIPQDAIQFFGENEIDFPGEYKIIDIMDNKEYTNWKWLIDEMHDKYIVVDWYPSDLKDRKIFKTLEGSYKYIMQNLCNKESKKDFSADDYDER